MKSLPAYFTLHHVVETFPAGKREKWIPGVCSDTLQTALADVASQRGGDAKFSVIMSVNGTPVREFAFGDITPVNAELDAAAAAEAALEAAQDEADNTPAPVAAAA